MKKNIFILLILGVLFGGCDDMFEPAIYNYRDEGDMYDEPGYAHGFLANGYTRIPTTSWTFNDVATDDAVTNDLTDNDYLKMATGQWAANNNPVERWRNCFAAIQYLNIMLAESDDVKWAEDEEVSQMFNDRVKGEAYGLRALFMYYLLQAHGGWANGTLLGVQTLTDPLNKASDFNIPRSTFEVCMQQVYSDIRLAEELLPLDYEEMTSDTEMPEKYAGIDIAKYNRVFNYNFRGLISGRIVKAVRAQAALLAASPSYSDGTTTTWADAAGYAAEVLDLNGGIAGIDSNGLTWYTNTTEIAGLEEGKNPKEILWRAGYSNSSSLESDNFPPTLFGRGRLNPTQNLVDAFPMLNGYPYDPATNASDPYSNRDPRLATYIIYNGSKFGVGNNTTISIESGNDAVNQIVTSTRTGYYMRKLLRNDVSYSSAGGSWNEQRHYAPRIRYTEIYLIYAEAANEAFGPDGAPAGVAYSARNVIQALRKRAGIGGTDDPYLASITSKEDMRELIRNERRLELCFEGHRFWDLRRWKVDISVLTEPAKGIIFNSGQITQTTVENRRYESYMYYCPIPYVEMLKYSALEQNDGWKTNIQ